MERSNEDRKRARDVLTETGAEVPDPTPMAPPVGYKRQPSMVEYIRDMVRSERLRAEVEAQGMESFEEADDFDVGDDYDPKSPYEAEFEPLHQVKDRATKARQEEEERVANEARSNERRPENPDRRSRLPDPEFESDPSPNEKSDVRGGKPEVGNGDKRAERKVK